MMPRVRHKRVLHVMASGERGGGADHLLGLLPAQRALGWHVQAAIGDAGPTAAALNAMGIETHSLHVMGARMSPQAVWALYKVCRLPVDIIHLHGTRAAFFAALSRGAFGMWDALARRTTKEPVRVYSAHGLAYRQASRGPMRRVRRAAEQVACRGVEAVISVSRGDLAELRACGIVADQLTAHVPNAVDVKRFAPGDKSAARRALGLPHAVPIVGTTARLVLQKAVWDLMDAVLEVPHAHLVVVGEGPERARLLAHPLALQGRAHLLGSRGDVPAILPAFDVFALSSHWEGEPIALLEALATGLGCVATDTWGAQEIFDDERLGRLVPIGDTAAMALALTDLLRVPALCRRLGAAGREAMQARSYAAQAQHVQGIYDALLRGAA